MKITEALLAEHKVLCALFANIERLLPTLTTLQELRFATQIVEGALEHHSKAEEDLLFSAFNQVCAHKNPGTHFYQEHRELHSSLLTVKMAEQPTHARDLLKMALVVSREHFSREERVIFPQAEQLMSPQTLETLGEAWLKAKAEGSPSFMPQNSEGP